MSFHKTKVNRPNYRIYDRTGGGATEDIYAESLEDAIEQGREWIEDGDWSSEDGSEDGIYRTITLECCVGEIVYSPDLSEIEAHLTEYGAAYVAGRILTRITNPDLEAGDLDKIRAELDGIATVDLDGRDEENYHIAVITPLEPLPIEIDEDATRDADTHNCDGEHSDELPECEAAEDGEHDWRSPHQIVGGLKENPGVWSNGGTRMSFLQVCACCGAVKHTHSAGSQRNPDEPSETVEITTLDSNEDAAEITAWLKDRHEEDGWLPEWLAKYLDCPPTVRMTEEQAKEWVEEHTDDDELDEEDLEHAFGAIFGRRAEDRDRAEGLWSHLCA